MSAWGVGNNVSSVSPLNEYFDSDKNELTHGLKDVEDRPSPI